jgi:hypothetical protein
MTTGISRRSGTAHTERLRELARRCREVSDLTAVPDVTRELMRIADDLEDEATSVEER